MKKGGAGFCGLGHSDQSTTGQVYNEVWRRVNAMIAMVVLMTFPIIISPHVSNTDKLDNNRNQIFTNLMMILSKGSSLIIRCIIFIRFSLRRVFNDHQSNVSSVDWDSNGECLLSCCKDNSVTLHSVSRST